MAADTKNRILEKALQMFSENGYNGTNLRELSQSLNLSKSALYRHYESKEEIWNAVLTTMISYYEEHFGSAEKLPAVPENTEQLMALTMRMVDFTVHDEKVIRMRRTLLIEQFREDRARKLATKYFLSGTEAMFTGLFEAMMKNGSLRQGDPAMLAFAYTAPITALIHLCDREPEREAETMEKARGFIRHFIAEYGRTDG